MYKLTSGFSWFSNSIEIDALEFGLSGDSSPLDIMLNDETIRIICNL
jgi:hypothetical protein